MEIPSKRLKELEDCEAKLRALEAGGVDNWEFYDESLSAYLDAKEREEKIEKLFDDVLENLCTNGKIEEPAGRGCGYGFRNTDEAFQIFKKGINKLK